MQTIIKGIFISILLILSFQSRADYFQEEIIANRMFNYEIDSDTNDIEYWRKQGYNEMVKGNYQKSIKFYSRVIVIDSSDYDAKLALARLYYKQEKFDSSSYYYNKIYVNDNSDVEALIGFGKCYYKKGKYDSSIHYYQLAIKYLPDYIPTYFDLSAAYIAKNKLDSTIIVYKKILTIDKTYAEAWEGVGKMLYWQGYPKSALVYYEKAIEFDPENPGLLERYKIIKKGLKSVVKLSFYSINEKEETYNIHAFIGKTSISKRFNDHIYFSINPMLAYSNKKFIDQSRENRWFDNTWIKINYLTPHHNIGLFLGASSNENILTSYGFNWDMSYNISHLKIKNSFTAAYDYFYYWNKVGHDYLLNTLNIAYRNISLAGGYRYAVVRENYIWEYYEKDINPNDLFNLSINYNFFKNPKITLGIRHSYRDYEYKSPLYYTPYKRSVNSLFASAYYSYKKIYSNIEYYYGMDNYDIINWTGSIEFGISGDFLNISVGASRFYNEYYENSNIFIAIKSYL